MISVKSNSTIFRFFTPKSPNLLQPSFITPIKSSRTFAIKFSATKSETIEHTVLFKVKEDTDESKINSMVNGLKGLTSLDQVLHLTVGPVFRTQPESTFTHVLHGRYKSKDDLNIYNLHPNHLSVVRESVLPICDDLMIVDWVASDFDEDKIVPKPGSAMKLKFLKLKEGVETEKVFGVFGQIKNSLIEQSSFGENFSLARAKGFSIASIAVFRGLIELEEYDSNEKAVKPQKEKVRDLVEGVIVVDYVMPPSEADNL